MLYVDNAVYFWPFFATIVSSMAYMVVVLLYYSCFRALLKGVTLSSTRKRRFMFIYISFLLFLTTWSMVQQIYAIVAALFYPDSQDTVALTGAWLSKFPPLLVPLIWAADGFMVI
ncbi:hypothetical protein GALMADRAFT_1126095 [Galerina marginata CBS 339.88]|uniref:Uncharacterized protein n=1 Tax=Galerina marginata (strain CBS 339.88) TaxID=685588 RepID=A0A067SB82_GALM3|nr:hypothetical protein GALMADRAFT_1126095 [Galerina marginata CBS 339.88]